MNNPQNVVILVLVVTAAILGGMLVGVWQDRSAQAAYPSVSKGDYIMIPYTWSDTMDLLCVIDVPSRKMKVYIPNKNTHAMDVAKEVDLEREFAKD